MTATSIIMYVYQEKEAQQIRMHEGVIRDQERQKYRLLLRGEGVETQPQKGDPSATTTNMV